MEIPGKEKGGLQDCPDGSYGWKRQQQQHDTVVRKFIVTV